ncbi:histidine methyltransferase 1 -like protein [Brachionus plicatilis]|uniref:protein-histidine N-methyltransferase n=1 Tax=Brachionus plicatilis TaxID=10195 RepID=A0A3M7STE6_BRAPC|nr:histidine methyltransferase 1 -like protein [Brachionus plicatilis]
MFKFNFQLEQNSDQTDLIEDCKQKQTSDIQSNEIDHNQIVGVVSYEDLIKKRSKKSVLFKNLILSNKCQIELMDSSKVILDQNDEISRINETHDVVPGKYEGGLKVWELSIDLAKFIYSSVNFSEVNLKKLGFSPSALEDLEGEKELRVLELGCGHALPVLAILKLIEEKLESDKLTVVCQFVHGDWQSLYRNKSLPDSYFDLILTSETIYNSANYKHLLNLFQLCLRNDELIKLSENALKNSRAQSMVLLSAKTYYFGCGGNILEFLNEAKSSNYSFETSQNLLYDDLINEKLIFIAREDTEQEMQNLGLKDTQQIMFYQIFKNKN